MNLDLNDVIAKPNKDQSRNQKDSLGACSFFTFSNSHNMGHPSVDSKAIDEVEAAMSKPNPEDQ